MSRRCVVPLYLLCLVLLYTSWSIAASGPENFRKVAADIERKYTSVGNIGLTVTNFGTIGTGNAYWPRQPSCEYPRGSRIEHVYRGSLWVGAVLKTQDTTDQRDGLILVSTGATDRGGEGYEFNAENADSITELSTLADDRPSTSQFSALAVSHQDFSCDYTDRFTHVPATGDSILNHSPLGIRVHQESYAWNFPFADFFVILRYVIYNASVDTLDSVYVGLWDNAVVRNTNYVQPRTIGYFDYTGQGFDKQQRMAYSFDFSGAPGGPPADSYVGVKLLGTTPFPSGVDSIGNLSDYTFYNAWQFRLSSGDEAYLSPTNDYNTNRYLSRYSRMTQSMPQDKIDPLRVTPRNVTYLLSTGPFHRLNPGDSLEVVFAVVCAKKNGTDPPSLDTKLQRQKLYANAAWAQQAYQGEDANGNNQLDPGEDIARRDSVSAIEFGLRYEPDGKITRYLLPAPPHRPKVRTEVEDRSVVLYWDKESAEESVDPILGTKDFEGYRVYRSNTGSDFLSHEDFILNLSVVGEFDRADDNIGYNTGFGQILLDAPKVFDRDSVVCHADSNHYVRCDTIYATRYWYRFPPKGVTVPSLNGWQYIYAISAFDKGDSANNVPSLESAKAFHRVIPGTPPTSNPSVEIGVYPNPYYVNALWDGGRERQRKIYFYNLPARCDITVYTLAGDVVTVLEHDASTNSGEGIEWFSQFGDREIPAEFAGGEHAWDLITRYDQAIATGLYLFTVKDHENGTIKRGKFLVIK
ncbi:MAG: hypothetical protein HY033_02405 [Ignavibacteriae bacterium]|nr:hypothetical protein [Ignavibacteria bacterium]MBI3363740.1 hypothetical protein [Ignavibacteriota bacterium]